MRHKNAEKLKKIMVEENITCRNMKITISVQTKATSWKVMKRSGARGKPL